MRACCITEVSHYKVHYFASILIMVGVIVGFLTLNQTGEDTHHNDYSYYATLLCLSEVFDVISHTTKEALVRSQPLDHENFNFRVSIF